MIWGPLGKVEYSRVCFVPLHLYSATSASGESPLLSVAPDPWIGVLMTRFVLAFSAGMVTFGVLPNEPFTETAALGLLGDEPQPATTAQAASAARTAAAMRRIGDFLGGRCQRRSQPT